MKTEENAPKDPNAALRGGTRITVHYRPESDLPPEEVLIREVTPQDVLDGRYVDLVRTDYGALLEWLCDRPAGWASTLTRESWTALREAEEALNFSFALAETEAAHRRGQRLKFVDEAMLEQQKKMAEVLELFGSSQNTSASPAAPKAKPSPTPSHGSAP